MQIIKIFIWIVIFLVFLMPKSAKSQFDLTKYYMQYVPQSTYTNPALAPSMKLHIGLPALSSNNMKFGHSAFAYMDIFERGSDDSLHFSSDNLLAKLDETNNYLATEMHFDAFSLGFKLFKTYFSFNVTEKIAFRFRYPKDFMTLALKGTNDFIGQTADFSGIGADVTHYREYGIGVARKIPGVKNLIIGAKAKLLYGKANVQSKRTDFTLSIDEQDYTNTATSSLLINTSGQMFHDSLDFDAVQYVLNTGNKGFAFDFGASYKINYKLSVNASFIDLGSIKWQKDVKNYYTDDASFTFSGLDIAELFTDSENSSESNDPIQELTDSIKEAFNIEESFDGYTTKLTPKFYLGAMYNLTYKDRFGALVHGDVFNGQIEPSITLSYNRRFGNFLSLTGAYSIQNGTFDNLGAGLAVNAGFWQFYLISDNILSPIKIHKAKNFSVHFGINLIFGYKVDKQKDESMID